MKINTPPVKEITDFESEIGVELVVNTRPLHSALPRFYVSFKGAEVSLGRFLSGAFGNGKTIDGALKDYSKEISEKTIVIGAYTPHRREIQCPMLIHTKKVQ